MVRKRPDDGLTVQVERERKAAWLPWVDNLCYRVILSLFWCAMIAVMVGIEE